ncbi:MAG: hypothetical protein AAF192_15140 [Pseudomonadota bacterium]
MADIGNIFELIGTHPIAKALLLVLALKAIWSLVQWRRCAWQATQLRAEAAGDGAAWLSALWTHSARFFLVMVSGIGLSVWGLMKIAHYGGEAPLGLLLLALGLYVILTEPIQRQIVDAENRATQAALRADEDGQTMAVSMVQGSRLSLVMIDVGGALALGLSILALSGGMPMPM